MKNRIQGSIVVRIALYLALFVVVFIGSAHLYVQYRIVDMPGVSFKGIPSKESEAIAEVSKRLKTDVEYLANEIGGRSIYNVEKLDVTKEWIVARFDALGLNPKVQSYEIEPSEIDRSIAKQNEILRSYGRIGLMPKSPYEIAQEVSNIWVLLEGEDDPDRLLVVGAHYDTVSPEVPGADDNSSGVAGLLEIARHLSVHRPKTSICLVAFTCEEYPIGGIDKMGSAVFVDDLLGRRSDVPVGMISLEMLGYYSDRPGSQKYPSPFSYYFPDTADFIGFVGDSRSRRFIRHIIGQFRLIPAAIPSEGVAAPVWLAPDVLRSDHAPFIEKGIPGLMVTDTSNFRYGDHYHRETDTPDKLDFTRMAQVVVGLTQVVERFEWDH